MKDFLGNYSHIVKGALAVAFILFLFYIGNGMRVEISDADISKLDANSAALESEGWPYPTEEEVRFVHPPQKKEEVVEITVDTNVTDVENDTDEVKIEAFGAELVKVDTLVVETDTTVTDTTKNQ